ncbi:MAG: AbrB/MazE/SpoVT family DNA-binding domain-containing protein [Proteobacteria bacterium]|nr:AbrB/MazE/SpoVT family DNA-binding domain-containing protein [Pseudomonadota bacterium]
MPRITSKGQVTIPQHVRNNFSLLPGTEVDIIVRNDQVLIVKSQNENMFLKWLGRGKRRNKDNADLMLDQLRGRIDD